MAELVLRNLSKRFSDTVTVGNIDLSLDKGEMVALLGPSGCGKTTILRMIAGLEAPSAGEIIFELKNLVQLPPQKRHLGMVFQNHVLFPHMTVFDNIAFGLKMRALPRAEIAPKVSELIRITQLGGLEQRYPGQLSGGQSQRVALARTLITEPALLLLDEPLSNLDASLRSDMGRFIRDIHGRLGLTTVFVTHDPKEAMTLADKVAVMANGRILQFGTPKTLFHQPVSADVARVLGKANILMGKIVGFDAHCIAVDTDIGRLQAPFKGAPEVGAMAKVMIRPEFIRLVLAQDIGAPATGTIEAVEFEGGNISCQVASGGTVLSAKMSSDHSFQPGDVVTMEIAADHVWLMEQVNS